jgi:hypothetical protein
MHLHSPFWRFLWKAVLILGLIVFVVGPTQAAKVSETAVVAGGTALGIIGGDAPVLVEAVTDGYEMDMGADGSLLGPGVRDPQPPEAPAPVPNIPPGIAAPAVP